MRLCLYLCKEIGLITITRDVSNHVPEMTYYVDWDVKLDTPTHSLDAFNAVTRVANRNFIIDLFVWLCDV